MIKRFANGGQAEQALLIQAFMLDLGIVLGATNETEALLAGQAAVEKLGENATKLFLAWGQAESLLQGAGRLVIAKALGGEAKSLSTKSLVALIGSMRPEFNAAPTSTAYAKLGTKIAHLNGKCQEGYEVEKYLAGGCVKCRKKKLLTLAEELKCGGKKRISKALEGKELPELKCGGKGRVKKHDDGGILDWLKKMLTPNKPTNWESPTVTYTEGPAVQETKDTKYGVNRFTTNQNGDYGVDGSFTETYTGQDGSNAQVFWPQGLGKGKKRFVEESRPGVADSLSYRYFNRPLPR